MRFENKGISSFTGRNGIDNMTPTANINGSVFINNIINGTFAKPYNISKTKDKWIVNTNLSRNNMQLGTDWYASVNCKRINKVASEVFRDKLMHSEYIKLNNGN